MTSSSTNPDFGQTLGFVFHPQSDPAEPGHPRLDIYLRPKPTLAHFDPEQVTALAVIDHDLETLEVCHPWPRTEHYQLVAGRVVMIDRLGKEQEAFCFGGQLEIQPGADLTLCVITSTAPLLNLTLEHSVAFRLAEEIEILLAQRRAAWGLELETYERRLAAVDPLLLYHACLDALRERFKHLPHSEDPLTQRLLHILRVESQAVHTREHVSPSAPALNELL